MADLSIILASSTHAAPLAPIEPSDATLAHRKKKHLHENGQDSGPYFNAEPLTKLNLHFIYAPTHKNGRLGAKRMFQATDEYWSCLVNRVA